MDTNSGSSFNEHPLRPYYVQPAVDSNWSTPSPSISQSSSSPSPYSSAVISPAVYLNRYEDSSVLPYSSTDTVSGGQYLKAFLISSFLTFTSTALVMPFEVGKTLAQVQYVPKITVDSMLLPEDRFEEEEEEEEEMEDEGQVEAYFSDLQSRGGASGSTPTLLLPPRSTSPSGYLRRSALGDASFGTKPEWIMPVVVQGGVWDMMRTLSKWKGEGWSSLWKGQLTTCCWDACSASIQPLILSPLMLLFLPSSLSSSPSAASSSSSLLLSSLPLMHSARPVPMLFLATLSHLATTLLLSPVDLIRTRLIVQSAQPQHRKYAGPLDAFNTILREEGGLRATYCHPHLLIPALLEGTLRPLFFLGMPLIIVRSLRIEPSASPLLFALAEFALGSAALLITIPIETVRKRLQIQSRAPYLRSGRAGGAGRSRAWRTCVETRAMPYAGVVDAIYRILTEETGRIPRRNRRRSSFNAQHPSSSSASASARDASKREGRGEGEEGQKEDLGALGAGTGLRQLYRGLGMGIGANLVVLLLGLLAGGADDRLRWTEM